MRGKWTLIGGSAAVVLIGAAAWTGRDVYAEARPLREAFWAQGFEGQFTLLVPSKDLVIVRLGHTGEAEAQWMAAFKWLGEVARAFPEASPITPPRSPTYPSRQ